MRRLTRHELEESVNEARSVVAGMREAVLEFELRPPYGEFVVLVNGDMFRIPPDRVSGYFSALDSRWKSPNVKRWSEEFRYSRRDKDIAEHELLYAKDTIKTLVAALERFVENGEGCPSCGKEGRFGCGCKQEQGRAALTEAKRARP